VRRLGEAGRRAFSPSPNANAMDPIPHRRHVIALRDSDAWARRAAPA
jgi:hypothetical protein